MTDDDSLLLTRIVIERHLLADGGDEITAEFTDRDGDTPPLVEILGLLAMTTDTALRTATDGDEE